MNILPDEIKCATHKNLRANILLFDEKDISSQVCLICAQNRTQNIHKIIDINEFLYADDNYIFSNFPPLSDEGIYTFLKDLMVNQQDNQQQIIIEKINSYFNQLKTDVVNRIDKVQNETKVKMVSLFSSNEEFLNSYNEISKKFELQKLYQTKDEDQSSQIQEIIQNMYENISQNTERLHLEINKYNNTKNGVSFTVPNIIKDEIFQLIDSIQFSLASKYDLTNIDIEKSKGFKASQQQQITRLANNQIEIRQTVNNHGVSYTNFILDPKKKYVFRVNIFSSSQNDNHLLIGLVSDNLKDKCSIYGNGLSYVEKGNSKGISKISKGSQVYEGNKEINKEIEVRIHLDQKLLKVANFPNYENVVELENKDLIKENEQYRFALELFYQVHKLVITYFDIVETFDTKM